VNARYVEPEMLDELPPNDPAAVGSRQDLVRLNTWMGNSRTMAAALRHALRNARARRVLELGAGDGQFLLRVARRLPADWEGSTAVLLDRHSLVAPETQQGFAAQGWRLELEEADVFDWFTQPQLERCDAVATNLFLHHFSDAQLTRLLAAVARNAKVFVAIEPRRAAWSLAGSRLVWLIGCNHVTRHDAPTSVRAGFAGSELSQLWPADKCWSLEERPAGWCSHLFVARRVE
jgi:SAM-dependent methyltransferase